MSAYTFIFYIIQADDNRILLKMKDMKGYADYNFCLYRLFCLNIEYHFVSTTYYIIISRLSSGPHVNY